MAYKDFMVKIGTLLGAKDHAHVVKEMKEVLEFEKSLARIYEPKEKLRNSENIYNKMTIADLQQMAPSVRMQMYAYYDSGSKQLVTKMHAYYDSACSKLTYKDIHAYFLLRCAIEGTLLSCWSIIEGNVDY